MHKELESEWGEFGFSTWCFGYAHRSRERILNWVIPEVCGQTSCWNPKADNKKNIPSMPIDISVYCPLLLLHPPVMEIPPQKSGSISREIGPFSCNLHNGADRWLLTTFSSTSFTRRGCLWWYGKPCALQCCHEEGNQISKFLYFLCLKIHLIFTLIACQITLSTG